MSSVLCNRLSRTQSLPKNASFRRPSTASPPAVPRQPISGRTTACVTTSGAIESSATGSHAALSASEATPAVSSWAGYLPNSRGVAVLSQSGAAGGRPKANQDSFLIHTVSPDRACTASVIGVFDGHGRAGNVASSRVKESIKESLEPCSRLALKAPSPCADSYAASSDDATPPSPRGFAASNLRSASAMSSAAGAAAAVDFTPDRAQLCLEETFARTAEAMSAAAADFMQSGSTAVVCMLLRDCVVVAHAGDSRAVVGVADGESYTAAQLTRDHKPNYLPEMARLLAAGGRVARVHSDKNGNPAGVSPGLSVARAFGDVLLQQAGVIPTPDVATFPLNAAAQAAGGRPSHILVVASDGLWEFVDSQAAVEIAAGAASPEQAAQLLLDVAQQQWHAVYQGRHRDDITVAVAFL